MLAAGEITVRALSHPTPTGEAFLGTNLLPSRWQKVAKRNREVLARAAMAGSYLVFDDQLGWTVGANRSTKDPYRKFQSEVQKKRAAPDVEIYTSSIEEFAAPLPATRSPHADPRTASR